jgi:DNA (cytosine-5)-methyltransferase 1
MSKREKLSVLEVCAGAGGAALALNHIDEVRPRAVLIENVPGILAGVFQHYRGELRGQLEKMGYFAGWHLLNASDFGVPQLRPRVAIVAIRKDIADAFEWPTGNQTPLSVGEVLHDLMAARGWRGARAWKVRADEIAPTIVGGSLKHGGPDLGPTRAKRAWATLGVDGMGIADEAPGPARCTRWRPPAPFDIRGSSIAAGASMFSETAFRKTRSAVAGVACN